MHGCDKWQDKTFLPKTPQLNELKLLSVLSVLVLALVHDQFRQEFRYLIVTVLTTV